MNAEPASSRGLAGHIHVSCAEASEKAPYPRNPLLRRTLVKKVADSSDSTDEPEDKDDKSRSKKNKVGYNILLFGQVTDFFNTLAEACGFRVLRYIRSLH